MLPPAPETFQGEQICANVSLIARTVIGENTVFTACFDTLADAAGNIKVSEYLSVLPKHMDTRYLTGVAIVPIMAKKIGLIRVFRHPLRRWSWEIPKGFVDRGESVEESAIRELDEETGLRTTAAHLRVLLTIAPEPGVILGRIRVFVADFDDKAQTNLCIGNDLGHDRIEFFSAGEIRDMMASGSLEDACTLAAVALCLLQGI